MIEAAIFLAIVASAAAVWVDAIVTQRRDQPGDGRRRWRATVALAAAVLVIGGIAWMGVQIGPCGDATLNPYCDPSDATIAAAVIPGPALAVLLFGFLSAETRRPALLALGTVLGAGSIAVFAYLADNWT